MDKKKTGDLIKMARLKKKYTQSELGDLIGVSNKAVSRWENGDSFPDVGILEKLANILEVRIQDIITGEVEAKDEKAVTEVLRMTVLQQKVKKRHIIIVCLWVITILCSLVSGYIGLCGSTNGMIDHTIFVLSMLFSLGMVSRNIWKQNCPVVNSSQSILLKTISLLSFGCSILITWILVYAVYSFKNINLSITGKILDGQLIINYFIGVTILCIEIYQLVFKKNGLCPFIIFFSIATIYITVMYGDVMHKLSNSFSEAILLLAARTIIVLGTSFIFYFCAQHNKNKDSETIID